MSEVNKYSEKKARYITSIWLMICPLLIMFIQFSGNGYIGYEVISSLTFDIVFNVFLLIYVGIVIGFIFYKQLIWLISGIHLIVCLPLLWFLGFYAALASVILAAIYFGLKNLSRNFKIARGYFIFVAVIIYICVCLSTNYYEYDFNDFLSNLYYFLVLVFPFYLIAPLVYYFKTAKRANNIFPFKAIIFDMDGVLIDSMNVWSSVDKEFLASQGIELPFDFSEKVKKMSWREAGLCFQEVGVALTLEEIDSEIVRIASEHYRSTIEAKPYLHKTLETLREKGYPMCVATASYPQMARDIFERLDIAKYFEFVISCHELGDISKSSPKIFHHCAERLCFKSKRILVVEDSLHSIETAKACGFITCAVYDEFSASCWDKTKEAADFFISDLNELLAKI